eukprot:CAMPEP_0169288988 /NCGR_PEP_ID=MMETSP1016-20121227/60876_1 /TAXON_ID=342587 /ORGANISM="Karlodinium micrum, Strain CCMP2283" /LENGTH=73 /DNA_ID=CAMNT_0009379301 /DNA_START=123 /DNA_END=344 /DNA_ORIENTATION=-
MTDLELKTSDAFSTYSPQFSSVETRSENLRTAPAKLSHCSNRLARIRSISKDLPAMSSGCSSNKDTHTAGSSP